jgi:NAD(P)-dependent dehydrogenase (short-subunit alcohol dehydrogenase family)
VKVSEATAGSGSLQGKVALVTGAATGLGLGIAEALAARGARLVLNDIDADRLSAAVEGLAGGGDAELVVADVSDAGDATRLVAAGEAITGRLDILVNNAGIQLSKPFADHTVADWDRVMGVNLRGPFLTMVAAVPRMIEAGAGSIVNISSISARYAGLPHAAYSASKAGVVSLTREAALELAPHGIRVNSVAPGPNATPMNEVLDPKIFAAIGDSIPIGRWGSPADIGAAVAFLASDEAAYITGAILPVTGGADIQLSYAFAAAQALS